MRLSERERSSTIQDMTGFTGSDWRFIGLASLTLVPLVLVLFFGVGANSPVVVAVVTGLAIIAAAFFLSWATEGMETVVPQSVALALLALIEVAPEYTFEVILAYRQQTGLAAASMTGANRLLLGLGWPLIFFVAYLAARRRGVPFSGIRLDYRNAPEILALSVATLYAFVMVVKRSFSLVDSAILVLIYILYIVLALRTGRKTEKGDAREWAERSLPADASSGDADVDKDEDEDVDKDEDEDEVGVAARLKELRGPRKWIAVGAFLAAGAFILYAGAERFIDALLQVGRTLNISEFILIQWVAPFLSEFPESLTAFIWAGMIVFASKGLSNLISSKLNQWTLLIAAIPIAYSVGLGHAAAVPLNTQVADELFLTAAQSVFGMALLLTLRFGLWEATALVILFFVQFFIPVEGIRVIIGWVYLASAAGVIVLRWRKVRLFVELRGPTRTERDGEEASTGDGTP